MIGLSLSLCVKDILNGKVAEADVEKIIASTKAANEADWSKLINGYCLSYWRKHPVDAVVELVMRLRPIVEQPRLTGNRYPKTQGTGVWVTSEHEIVWNDDEE